MTGVAGTSQFGNAPISSVSPGRGDAVNIHIRILGDYGMNLMQTEKEIRVRILWKDPDQKRDGYMEGEGIVHRHGV